MELKKNEALYLNELNSAYSQHEILNLIGLQLEKDFTKCGLSFSINHLENFEQLKGLLLLKLQEMSVNSFEQLSYVADLPENINCIDLFQRNELNTLSELLIYRALSKVYFRFKYST